VHAGIRYTLSGNGDEWGSAPPGTDGRKSTPPLRSMRSTRQGLTLVHVGARLERLQDTFMT
jgi:hypothetical protein